MSLPTWVSTDWTKVFFAAEKQLSPKLEAALGTDVAMDVLAVSLGLRRIVGRAAAGLGNGVVEALGLPSSRQVRQLQRSVDELHRIRL